MPIVAKVKNIDEKKNRNPWVSPLLVEAAELNKFLSCRASPLASALPPAACILSDAMSSLSAILISAVCAVLVLS